VVKLRKPLTVREPTGSSPFGPASPAPAKQLPLSGRRPAGAARAHLGRALHERRSRRGGRDRTRPGTRAQKPRANPAGRSSLSTGRARHGTGRANGPCPRVRCARDGPGARDPAHEPAWPKGTGLGPRKLAGRAPPGLALPGPPDQLAGRRLRVRAPPHHGAGADHRTTLEPSSGTGIRSGLALR
jgi:hypothetical protein